MYRMPRYPHAPRAGEPAGKHNPSRIKAGMAGVATTVLVWGGLGLSGLGLAAHFAHADPPRDCAPGKACIQWCPGDPDPAARPVPWDPTVCHTYFWDFRGVHDVGTGSFYSWSGLPYDVPPPPGPVPTETSYLPLPTLNFCPVPPWCP
jgi:hypothetical protein